jgi:transcriptional regulator with XRE-family HTH domain
MGRSDLVEASGISYPYLAGIETGKKSPSVSVTGKIARALGITKSHMMLRAEQILEDKMNWEEK